MLYFKLHVFSSLMLGSLLVGVCRAQGSGYFYPVPESDPGNRSGYQWRPVDGQQSPHAVDVQSFRRGAEPLTGQHQLEWDVSPNIYRPIKDPQTLSPWVGAYRFRTISPEEQSQYVTTEAGESGARSDSTPTRLRFRAEDSNQNLRLPGIYNQPRFRPDDELSSGSQRPATAYPQYKLPVYSDPVYSAPVFTEGARDRQ